MGMFDTFHGDGFETQMKCFYIPFSSGGVILHSGGTMSDFHIGDELPLETNYYKFEENCIFLTDEDDYKYIYVKDKFFISFLKTINDIPPEIHTFYTRHGERLNANTILELIQCEHEMNARYESPEYNDFFIQPSFEERLAEYLDVMLKNNDMNMFYNNETLKKMWECESQRLKENLRLFEQEDSVKYENYLKNHNMRLKFLFI